MEQVCLNSFNYELTQNRLSMHQEVIFVGFALKCPMPGCTFETNANSKEELLKQGMDHAKTAHNLTTLPPDVLAKVTAAIRQTP
jgi:predicted small metal-binding protein